MAKTTKHLRDLLEKIKSDAQRALALLSSETELRSLGWKCTACRYIKHFTKPVPLETAGRRPRCKSTEFQPFYDHGEPFSPCSRGEAEAAIRLRRLAREFPFVYVLGLGRGNETEAEEEAPETQFAAERRIARGNWPVKGTKVVWVSTQL